MGGYVDHFSAQAAAYAGHRPVYPDALFAYLADRCTRRRVAWDCACGSGQSTRGLIRHFDRVLATDASLEQLRNTRWPEAVSHWVSLSHASGVPAGSVDLITVAQALHWFDLDRFYGECRAVLKPGGLLAVWTYGLVRIEAAIDDCVADFYHGEIGPYWPARRRWVESAYAGIEFPFPRLSVPDFEMRCEWDLAAFLGYLRSWSAVAHYLRERSVDPVQRIEGPLAALWGSPDLRRTVRWPLTLWLGCHHPAGPD